ncbi:MAG: hypothetical protein WA191_02395 [Telluria sp.]
MFNIDMLCATGLRVLGHHHGYLSPQNLPGLPKRGHCHVALPGTLLSTQLRACMRWPIHHATTLALDAQPVHHGSVCDMSEFGVRLLLPLAKGRPPLEPGSRHRLAL